MIFRKSRGRECAIWGKTSNFKLQAPEISLYSFNREPLDIAVVILGYVLTLIIGYLLGSIPTGFLVAKARGLDIRTVGSGNIGATNVFRYLGKPAGIFVLLADALKGWLAVVVLTPLVWTLFHATASPQAREWLAII